MDMGFKGRGSEGLICEDNKLVPFYIIGGFEIVGSFSL